MSQLSFPVILSTSRVNMNTSAGAQTLYTVPTGKVARILFIVVRDTSASLAGGTQYSFTNWRQLVDLSGLTTPGTDYIALDGNNAKYTELAAGTAFQITPTTGTAGITLASIEVFGYLT